MVKIEKNEGKAGFWVDLASLVELATSSSSSTRQEEDLHLHLAAV